LYEARRYNLGPIFCTKVLTFLKNGVNMVIKWSLVDPCNGETRRLLKDCEGGECISPEINHWSEWGECDCTMKQLRTRTCKKTKFDLTCKEPLEESRECYTEVGCTNEQIEAFLNFKTDLSQNFDEWKTSRRNDPFREIIIEGYTGYTEDMDFNSMTPFFRTDPLFYHKYGRMVIFRSGKIQFIVLETSIFVKIILIISYIFVWPKISTLQYVCTIRNVQYVMGPP